MSIFGITVFDGPKLRHNNNNSNKLMLQLTLFQSIFVT